MKCTYKKQISEDVVLGCNGEMIEVGETSVVGQVTTKLYQCEICKTIKLI